MGSRTETNHYLNFELIERKLKTVVYLVKSSFNGEALGRISWHWTWRRYGFYPINDTVFDSSCLGEIREFIDTLMKEREEQK